MKTFDDKRFADMLETRKLGRDLIHLTVTSSTNDHAAGIIDKEDISNGTMIIADRQTGGRGRFNRDWISPPGGLWFSLVMKTDLSGKQIPLVTLMAAYAAADTLMTGYGIDAVIKWPNDLYLDDSKFGGILSEGKDSRGQSFIILGMGLNIDVDRGYLDRLNNKAASIQEFTEKKIIPESLLAKILKRFEDMYFQYDNTGEFNPIFKKIEKILRY